MLPDKYKDNKGVIRVSNKHVDDLKGALTMVETIGRDPVIVRSRGVSGILKKLEKKYLAG